MYSSTNRDSWILAKGSTATVIVSPPSGSQSADARNYLSFESSSTGPVARRTDLAQRVSTASLLAGAFITATSISPSVSAQDDVLVRALVANVIPQSAGLTTSTVHDRCWSTIADEAIVQVEQLPEARRPLAQSVLEQLRTAYLHIHLIPNSAQRIHTTWTDDGALLLEWQIASRRLGISFESEEPQSGWFYVEVDPQCPVRMQGKLNSFRARDVLERLLGV